MKANILILLFFVLCNSSYAQSPGLALQTGVLAMHSKDKVVNPSGGLNYGWLVGADARILEGDLYFMLGAQYIQTSIFSDSKPNFFSKNDWSLVAGRLGLGFNILHLGQSMTLRSKLLGSINYTLDSPDNGLNIDGYKVLNESTLGILSGLGLTYKIIDIDFEYQYPIFNTFYKQPSSKFNVYSLTAGIHF